MGHAGAVSFNYYKNMTCGEGGAVITGDDLVAQRARCMIDPCSFYWEGRQEGFVPFLNSGSRLSELQAAMLNAQLDRLPALLAELREVKERILDATFGMGLTPTPRHSPEGECATAVMYLLPSKIAAELFSEAVSGTILLDTGRHTFIEWDPILSHQGSHHPALNPFSLPENAACRKDYRKDMCPRSLDILSRTVSVSLIPVRREEDLDELISRIDAAARAALQAS
jgi:dTDP-4-amino-4,6-dideoxygalactose transaminase